MRVPLIDWEPYAPLQPLHLDWLVRAGVEVAVLRLDLIDPLVSGNKWFKLHQPLHAAHAAGAHGLISLGGAPVTGRGKITGMPLRPVRIDLPSRVPMTAPDGSSAELVDFTTNLPHRPTLDANGQLEFSFGARLVVRNGSGGNYRGRIPITVDYN